MLFAGEADEIITACIQGTSWSPADQGYATHTLTRAFLLPLAPTPTYAYSQSRAGTREVGLRVRHAVSEADLRRFPSTLGRARK